MADQTNSTRLVVILPMEMSDQVDVIAQEEGMTRSQVGRKALRKYLEATCRTDSK